MKAICIISGGMDSATTAYIAKNLGYEIFALHFDYGQKTMKKERECFYKICDDLNVKNRQILDLNFISQIGGNALTDFSLKIPQDGLTDEVPTTYVPFRNGVFISIAAAFAEKIGADAIFLGVVEEDSSGYPDCSEEFIQSAQTAINSGTKKTTNIKILTPLVHLSKADIVKKANELKVKLEHTWSCYKNEDEACGLCDSCRLRLNGFSKAGLKDKIKYKGE